MLTKSDVKFLNQLVKDLNGETIGEHELRRLSKRPLLYWKQHNCLERASVDQHGARYKITLSKSWK